MLPVFALGTSKQTTELLFNLLVVALLMLCILLMAVKPSITELSSDMAR